MPNRINSIDAIRGFCLLNIFINHLAVGSLRFASPSRVAFSDSAEAFVFLAGISCFLAYGPRGEAGLFPAQAGRMWRRARTLFLFNLSIIAATIALSFAGSAFAEPANPSILPPALIGDHGIVVYAWHVLTMQQTVGYSVVLRLYVALLLIAPCYVWLAAKRFWYPLVPAGAIWLVAGHFGLAEKDSLSGVPLALTILPWNLVFATGISLGAAIVQRVDLPTSRPLTVLAAVLVLAGPLCFVVGSRLSPELLAWIDQRNDFFWTGASKSLQSPLRVSYMFALTYLVIALRKAPVMRLIHQVSPGNPLCRLGRRSLQVFTCGAILATAGNQLLWSLFEQDLVPRGSAGALAVELAIAAIGFAAMLCVAIRVGPAAAKVASQPQHADPRPA
jgi:hypothetical protein